MSTKTEYICDRCKGVFVARKDLYTVTVYVKKEAGTLYLSDYDTAPYPRVDWCEKCCREKGLVYDEKPVSEETKNKRPSLEDLVREIITEQTGAC